MQPPATKISLLADSREGALLKVMCSTAVQWEILDHNPLVGLKLPKEAPKRNVFLSQNDAALLINEVSKISEMVGNIVEFAIYSGFRKENILSMTIEDIQFHNLTNTGEAMLTIKGGSKQSLPLGVNAIEVVKRVIESRKSGYVFINPKTEERYVSINKTFDKVVKKIGLSVNGTKLRFHDLRHVFASWLHQAGVSIDSLRSLLGHKDRATTDRYITMDPRDAKDALENMPKIELDRQEKWQELARSS